MTPSEIAGWRTSSRTSATQTCVEVGRAPGVAGVRDTKNRGGAALRIANPRWSAFIGAIKAGQYDH
ncbi:DUF397 domain-containing protein [Saccharopolyspora sp. SCSIO 74807]|uniref:DUF397 domain-containing protein n=1 Tax=Saccharopolyspora sp. SCSIO 74807 TaxID=3118084 RepID=UPI0030CE4164